MNDGKMENEVDGKIGVGPTVSHSKERPELKRCSNPRLWSQPLHSHPKTETVDTADQNKPPLLGVCAHRAIKHPKETCSRITSLLCWKEPIEVLWASYQDDVQH